MQMDNFSEPSQLIRLSWLSQCLGVLDTHAVLLWLPRLSRILEVLCNHLVIAAHKMAHGANMDETSGANKKGSGAKKSPRASGAAI